METVAKPENTMEVSFWFTENFFNLLMEISTEPGPDKTLSALTCSALLSLVTALGDTGKLLTAVTAMLMAPGALASQDIVVNNIFVFNT